MSPPSPRRKQTTPNFTRLYVALPPTPLLIPVRILSKDVNLDHDMFALQHGRLRAIQSSDSQPTNREERANDYLSRNPTRLENVPNGETGTPDSPAQESEGDTAADSQPRRRNAVAVSCSNKASK